MAVTSVGGAPTERKAAAERYGQKADPGSGRCVTDHGALELVLPLPTWLFGICNPEPGERGFAIRFSQAFDGQQLKADCKSAGISFRITNPEERINFLLLTVRYMNQDK